MGIYDDFPAAEMFWAGNKKFLGRFKKIREKKYKKIPTRFNKESSRKDESFKFAENEFIY